MIKHETEIKTATERRLLYLLYFTLSIYDKKKKKSSLRPTLIFRLKTIVQRRLLIKGYF